ncbi:HAD family hydrolase [Microbacterium aerolatum]|uniref:HAD family hydrolase n=1 Tax=Microbacterium aerolatum TaxID=153731 RepID=UPI002001714F|nr:HAD family hydrolase [Microbacterium aerolatum]MCK3769119.1 HAD family hydrolase [Microbacterium aerolatum]
MTVTIVLDFDGTIALGAGPLEAFARAVASAASDTAFADRAIAAVAAFERGESEARDGYDVVSTLAAQQGVTADALEAAYQSSRALLGSEHAAIAPPRGLADFLTKIGADARVVLATNAPGAGIRPVLEGWHVADLFDAMHFTVGKPDGLVPIIRAAVAEGPVLSVGDIFEFDLAPAAQLGAATALVGATAERSPAAVTMRGRTIADLYGDIEAWAAVAASSTPTGTTLTERHDPHA